jgi:large subunit ribosomal protein L19
LQEKIRKKIGIDIDVKPETVTEENLAPVAETKKEELLKQMQHRQQKLKKKKLLK